jgi:hypothetical protein
MQPGLGFDLWDSNLLRGHSASCSKSLPEGIGGLLGYASGRGLAEGGARMTLPIFHAC